MGQRAVGSRPSTGPQIKGRVRGLDREKEQGESLASESSFKARLNSDISTDINIPLLTPSDEWTILSGLI